MTKSNKESNTKKIKYTTNLTAKCLNDIEELCHIFKVRNRNQVIEHLVEKEITQYEVDKERDTN